MVGFFSLSNVSQHQCVYCEVFITTQREGTFPEPVLRVTAGGYRKK